MNSNSAGKVPWTACIGRAVFAAAMIAISINGLLIRARPEVIFVTAC